MSEFTEVVRAARDRGVEALLRAQHPDGWWKGELQANVTIDAEDLLLRQFLGIRTEHQTERTAFWIRSQQRDDGTWATYTGGPGDLSTTAEAYTALRLAGDPPDAAHMEKAATFIRDAGGLERTRVFTHLWLALGGRWSWDDVPALPPEVILLPEWCPLNIYDFACWARQTVVALTVVGAHRPVRPLPFELDELRTGAPPPARRSLRTTEGKFELLDRMLHRYERRPLRPLRRAAIDRAIKWILSRQEADGGWGGIQPPWVYSLLALHLEGLPLDHPVIRKGFEGLDSFTIDDDLGRRIECCQSPVWDTALAMIALSDAGLPPDHPALVKAAEWTVGQEIRSAGDWAVKRPDLEPSGWAFEFENDNYADTDDTAIVGLALRRVHVPDGADTVDGIDPIDAACGRARRWLEGMQSEGGGWGAFDADNTRDLCRRLPFCDFGEVIDPPSADVTAHVIEFLAAEPNRDLGTLRAGRQWLVDQQEDDGSWFGRWGANHVYGTCAALTALQAAGVHCYDRPVRRAVKWLEDHQNADGGWGEDLRSYVDDRFRGRGESTASQTAWALIGLLASGVNGDLGGRGVRWLVDNQREDGTWDEPYFTGVGFPGDFYINYHLYRQVFPVSALGRYLSWKGIK
jgi:squalene-hopene/tetraprenyl-beta-curcumene cyclase